MNITVLDGGMRLACQLAVDARDRSGVAGALVAGSLGPQGFSYQPDHCPSAEQAAEVYQQICSIQSDLSSVDQARGALMGAAEFGKPIWVSLSVDDNDGSRLRSGEPVADFFPLIDEYKPEAVLINCSVPEAVSNAIPIIESAPVRIGAYANGFTAIHKDFSSIGATRFFKYWSNRRFIGSKR